MYPSILQPADDSAHFSVYAKHTYLMRVPVSPYTDMLTNGMQVLHPITVKTLVLRRRYLSGNFGIWIFRISVIRYTAHSFPFESSATVFFLFFFFVVFFSNYALYDVSFPQASISKK